MKIEWHCRTCNQFGNQDIPLADIVKEENLQTKKKLLDSIKDLIVHECSERNIGIRASEK